MSKTIIFGITPFSFLIKADMESDGRPVDAFAVDRAYMPETWTDHTPLVAFEDLRLWADGDDFELILTPGYKRMNENRRAVYERCLSFGYQVSSFIHSGARCEAESLGPGNIILDGCHISRFTRIGCCNIFVNDTVLGHESVVGDFNFFAGITTGGKVRIGSNCFFGMKSIVCNDLTVADFTLLGAGTVLSKDSEDHTVIFPAKNRTIKLDLDGMNSLLV